MALIVQKYGGTSVGDTDRIKNVARRCIAAQAAGHDVVVVVSAMSGETNRLLKLVSQITDRPSEREQDVVVATGEQVSIGLLAMAIQAQGGQATSFLGHQVRIVTDNVFSKARIKRIDAEKIVEALKQKHIVVVAGFQGLDEQGNVTTLGRGGSDTTAVALAAALKADACEIYTDVDGVYTTDPNVCPAARKLDRISYEEMLELASAGRQGPADPFGRVRDEVQGAALGEVLLLDDPGTLVCEEDKSMENVVVSGVAYDKNEAKLAISGVPDVPGVAAKIFGALDEQNIVVDLIVQTASRDGRTDLTFTVGKTDLVKAKEVVARVTQDVHAGGVETDDDVAKVSIVGVGMRNHSGVAAKMFQVLASEGINIQIISTSEIKVSCLIQSKYTELAVRALHTAFGLDKAPAAS